MGKGLLTWILWVLPAMGLSAQYAPDVLGHNYVSRTLQMPADYEGEVVCTLIKKPALPGVKQAVLYIHGYNDYFFQHALGDSLNRHGYNFYAIDLRKYGRSLRPHQQPFFCKQVNEYYADIDTALSVIRSEGNGRILLMGHSTGGLIAALYQNDRQGKRPAADGLILNSPFLDMNMSWLMEKIVIPVVSLIGQLFPGLTVQGSGIASYAHSLLRQFHGEWEYDTGWKQPQSPPKKAGWISAIHQAHRRVQKGLPLTCPVLLLSSDSSFPETKDWQDEYMSADIVLDVEDIQRYGAGLGDSVTYRRIPQGIHDLILSPQPARDHAYQTIFHWLQAE